MKYTTFAPVNLLMAISLATVGLMLINKMRGGTGKLTLVRETEDSLRKKVVQGAMSQIGNKDPQPYWINTTGTTQSSSLSWCGAFALTSLHNAGLALNKMWQMGKGFLLTGSPLKTTKSPKPGDIAYYDKNQHHAVVAAVYPDSSVDLINGNGTNKSVSPSHTKMSTVTAFYSIQPLIDQKLAFG